MLPNIGPMELVIFSLLVLIIFGPRRLPEMGGSLGRGIREFRRSISGDAEGKKLPSPDTHRPPDHASSSKES